MSHDKKILFGFGIFICSFALISIIKGTYAYPATMENTSGGKIVPLGGDEVCSKCGNSYIYAPVGEETCTPVADSYCTSNPSPSPSPTVVPTPSPSPTVVPTPSPSSTVKPTPSPSSTVKPIPNPSSTVKPTTSSSPNSYCYECTTDNNVFYWGIYPGPSAGSNSCNGSWKVTAKTHNQCRAEDILSNPNTVDVMLYIAYLIGFSSLFYSGYSFYRYKRQNNK